MIYMRSLHAAWTAAIKKTLNSPFTNMQNRATTTTKDVASKRVFLFFSFVRFPKFEAAAAIVDFTRPESKLLASRTGRAPKNWGRFSAKAEG